MSQIFHFLVPLVPATTKKPPRKDNQCRAKTNINSRPPQCTSFPIALRKSIHFLTKTFINKVILFSHLSSKSSSFTWHFVFRSCYPYLDIMMDPEWKNARLLGMMRWLL